MEEGNGDGTSELGGIGGVNGDRFSEQVDFPMFERKCINIKQLEVM